jgi:hypothetical protein
MMIHEEEHPDSIPRLFNLDWNYAYGLLILEQNLPEPMDAISRKATEIAKSGKSPNGLEGEKEVDEE